MYQEWKTPVTDPGVESVENKIQEHKSNWLNHESTMENTRLMMSHKPREHNHQ